jgi:predicted lipoprotein
MHKEVIEITKACDSMVARSNEIKSIANEIKKTVSEIEVKTNQEEAVNKSLAMHKELANLYILSSNIEDNFKMLEKIHDSLGKI